MRKYLSLALVLFAIAWPTIPSISAAPKRPDPTEVKIAHAAEIGLVASQICNSPEAFGFTRSADGKLGGSIDIPNVLKRLLDVGVSASVKGSYSDWKGPLQRDFAGMRNTSTKCAEDIFRLIWTSLYLTDLQTGKPISKPSNPTAVYRAATAPSGSAPSSPPQFGIQNNGGHVGKQTGKGQNSIQNNSTDIGDQDSDTSGSKSSAPGKHSEVSPDKPMLDAHGEPCKFIVDDYDERGTLALGFPPGTDVMAMVSGINIPDDACYRKQSVISTYGTTKKNNGATIDEQTSSDNHPEFGVRNPALEQKALLIEQRRRVAVLTPLINEWWALHPATPRVIDSEEINFINACLDTDKEDFRIRVKDPLTLEFYPVNASLTGQKDKSQR